MLKACLSNPCAETLAAEPERSGFLRKLGIEARMPSPIPEACDGTGQTVEI
jgi:hypothetical protein